MGNIVLAPCVKAPGPDLFCVWLLKVSLIPQGNIHVVLASPSGPSCVLLVFLCVSVLWCVCVCVCVCVRPFKTHADPPPQLHDAPCGYQQTSYFYSTSSLFCFWFTVCVWPSPPTPCCPIFLIATFCHSNSAQRWVTGPHGSASFRSITLKVVFLFHPVVLRTSSVRRCCRVGNTFCGFI